MKGAERAVGRGPEPREEAEMLTGHRGGWTPSLRVCKGLAVTPERTVQL